MEHSFLRIACGHCLFHRFRLLYPSAVPKPHDPPNRKILCASVRANSCSRRRSYPNLPVDGTSNTFLGSALHLMGVRALESAVRRDILLNLSVPPTPPTAGWLDSYPHSSYFAKRRTRCDPTEGGKLSRSGAPQDCSSPVPSVDIGLHTRRRSRTSASRTFIQDNTALASPGMVWVLDRMYPALS